MLEAQQYRPARVQGVRLALIAACLVQLLPAVSSCGQSPPNPPIVVVPHEYFGMHMHRVVARGNGHPSAWPEVGIGAWRLWDSYTAWSYLEPARGIWNFATLDSSVALAERHHVEVLLTLGVPPSWASRRPEEPSDYGPGGKAPPRDIGDWRDYVRTVATRYRGRIHAYEIWNEPNLPEFFSGTTGDLVELAREAHSIIHSIDPRALVVAPSPTGQLSGVAWLDGYLARGGAHYADVIGFHFYVSPAAPERMVPLAQALRGVMARHGISDRPLWNTESGWYIQSRRMLVPTKGPRGASQSRVLGEQESAAWTSRALIVGWCAGVGRFYWYAWDNKLMGLIEADAQTMKPAARAYRATREWLVGARVTACERRRDGAWIVTLRRGGGGEQHIVWAEDDSVAMDLPGSWRATSVTMLLGGRTELRDAQGARRVAVGSTPILFTSQPQSP